MNSASSFITIEKVDFGEVQDMRDLEHFLPCLMQQMIFFAENAWYFRNAMVRTN